MSTELVSQPIYDNFTDKAGYSYNNVFLIVISYS